MKAKLIRFDDNVLNLVEEWRKQFSTIPSFNRAVNSCLFGFLNGWSLKDWKALVENEINGFKQGRKTAT